MQFLTLNSFKWLKHIWQQWDLQYKNITTFYTQNNQVVLTCPLRWVYVTGQHSNGCQCPPTVWKSSFMSLNCFTGGSQGHDHSQLPSLSIILSCCFRSTGKCQVAVCCCVGEVWNQITGAVRHWSYCHWASPHFWTSAMFPTAGLDFAALQVSPNYTLVLANPSWQPPYKRTWLQHCRDQDPCTKNMSPVAIVHHQPHRSHLSCGNTCTLLSLQYPWINWQLSLEAGRALLVWWYVPLSTTWKVNFYFITKLSCENLKNLSGEYWIECANITHHVALCTEISWHCFVNLTLEVITPCAIFTNSDSLTHTPILIP